MAFRSGQPPFRLTPPPLMDDPPMHTAPYVSPWPAWPWPPTSFRPPRGTFLPGRLYMVPPPTTGWGSALSPSGAAQAWNYQHGGYGLENWVPQLSGARRA